MTNDTSKTSNSAFRTEPMEGYKAFDENLQCRGFQYEVGKTYTMNEEPKICDHGFHFCKTIKDCYCYYNMGSRVCKVRATGLIAGSNKDDFESSDKYCTNKITILEEITDFDTLHCNTGDENTGHRNTGDRNTGDRNTGYFNTGNYNTGHCNTGEDNTGNYNTGNYNTGHWNTGDRNTGDLNTGNYNTGDRNTGNYNTGCFNTGYRNTGDCNTGNYNTGDFNSCDHETGCFCTEEPTIRLFNQPSNWTYTDWVNSKAFYCLCKIPFPWTETKWIDSDTMTDKEKEQNPKWETTGGYLKTIRHNKSRQVWWNNLSEDEKQTILDLPNFNADIFKECTGIDVNQR